MREIGVLPDASQARTLADYLLTLRIETRLIEENDGWAVWVCDEDRVPQAREELDAFRNEPQAPKYSAAVDRASAIREEENQVESDYQRRQTELRRVMAQAGKQPASPPVVTWIVMFVMLAVAVDTQVGQVLKGSRLAHAFFLAPIIVQDESEKGVSYTPSPPHWFDGQPWRLVTPIFLHLGLPHLVMNLLAWHQLGTSFELRRGSLRLVLFTLASAVASNIPQYYLGHLWDYLVEEKQLHPNPLSGGISGVCFGLFGYMWVKSRLDPDAGFVVTPNQVILMIGWYFLCFTGLLGSIGNVAHTAGLLFGMLVAAAPVAWRKWRHHES
jgi:GlpG protein